MSVRLRHAAALLLLVAPVSAQQGAFHNLRFEEDWSFLADPEAETAHRYPEIKFIDVGQGWTLSLGGQERVRAQQEFNRSLTGAHPQRNDFILNRVRLHADLRHESGFRTFVELLDARISGAERRPIGIDRNVLDVQNAFVEYGRGDTLVRGGRMELQYGTQRFVSPLEWGNTRRRFEGALARHEFDGGSVDAFVTKPVDVDRQHLDHDDDSRWFSGIYSAFGDGALGVDAYVLAFNETSNAVTGEAGNKGGFDIYTVGLRPHGKHGAFEWEAEVARQTGGFAGDPVRAESYSGLAAWTAADLPGKPRAGLRVDVATGDSDPTDNVQESFDQLFPLAHAYLGLADLVGRSNIIAVQPEVQVQLDASTKLRVAYHDFRLFDRRDALYNAGGKPSLADPTGRAGTDVGRELDLTLMHSLQGFGPHAKLLAGYSRFWPGAFVDALGSSSAVNVAYVQFLFTF